MKKSLVDFLDDLDWWMFHHPGRAILLNITLIIVALICTVINVFH